MNALVHYLITLTTAGRATTYSGLFTSRSAAFADGMNRTGTPLCLVSVRVAP